jgi:hypothetical protein
MDESKKTSGRYGYGDGYTDGWLSVTGSGPVPPHSGLVPVYALPEGKSVYEYGYEQGRAEAAAEKSR